MQLSLSLQTLTGADEPQSMIVMSYRSAWENRGTERGEVGRRNKRMHTQKEVDGQKKKNNRKTSDELNTECKLLKTGYQYWL